MRRSILVVVACAATAVLTGGCANEPIAVYDMVSPQVTEVSPDGLEAKVNIGIFDHVRAGQRLYVVRGSEMTGILTVRQPREYGSDCVVVASNQSAVADDATVKLHKVRAGDLVVRSMKYIANPARTREKVPRMVPVPYEAYNEKTEMLKVGEREIKIPRDQVDAWRKSHPIPAGASGGS